jgi:hypothetical protein
MPKLINAPTPQLTELWNAAVETPALRWGR